MNTVLKMWMIIVGLMFVQSVLATEGPIVTVFSNDIVLKPDCVMNARPSVTGGSVYYSCSGMSIHFKKEEFIDIEYLARQGFVVSATQESVDYKEYELIAPLKISPTYIYILCDYEVCMQIISESEKDIDGIVIQVEREMVHNKSSETDAGKLRGASR